MPRETYTRTANEVAEDVKRIFGDESLVELKNNDLIRWISAAEREVASSHEVIKGSVSHDVAAGVNAFTNLPSIIHQIQAIHYDGTPLKPVSFQSAQETIVSNDPDIAAEGEPKIWYEWDGDIFVYPTPDKDLVDGLKLFYIGFPEPIVLLTDSLHVPDRFYNQIVDYVLGQAYRLDENWQASSYQDQRFRDSMNRQLAKENVIESNFYATKVVLPEDE
jgi:hypothetical protein